MKPESAHLSRLLNFRSSSSLYVALASLVLLTPFSINNFLSGRDFIGIGALLMVVILSINAWLSRSGDYRPMLTFIGVVPLAILFLHYVIGEQGIIGLLWCYPAAVAFYFMLPERQALLANAALLLVNVPLAWSVTETEVAIRITATLMAVSLFSAIFVRVIACQHRQLHTQLITDPLTGLSNRVLLQASLERAAEQKRRTGLPMSLLAVDMDHFKAINDTLGHDAGDEVLRGVGELLRRRTRCTDTAFRFGGEEFLLLLFDTPLDSARRFAEELREEIAGMSLLADRQVTVSIGVAALQPDEAWKAWMKRSDDNLYLAKAAGRNRVEG